jgi:outer membrane protein OmpA-like peptidoglycan-associated protein
MRIIGFILFILLSISLIAQQNVAFKKVNFPKKKDQLKEAIQNISDGDYYYSKGRQSINVALSYYIRANDFNPNNALLNFKIAKCYLRVRPEALALVFLDKAIKLDPKVSEEYYLILGKAYQRNLMFDKAIKAYHDFKASLSPQQTTSYHQEIDKYIRECEVGKEMIAHPVRVFIDNLGGAVNSEYADYWPVINVDESRLYFTSRRMNTTGGEVDENDEQYYEDIFFSDFKNGYWAPSQNISKPINSDGHDAVVGRSPDGQMLLIYRNNGRNGGDIYWSELRGEEWSKPRAFPKPINSSYHESSATISYDGRRIYFVSNRPGGYGGKDIYYCKIDEKGRWGEAINLGNSVNSKYDEIGVYMHADGKTLYFSSDGHAGMGSFDVYKSIFENGYWSEPINLGYPINSPDPDAFFTIAASGRHAYYSSVREGGMGDQDIYLITFLGPEKPLVYNTEDLLLSMGHNRSFQNTIEDKIQIQEHQLTLLKGIITDALNNRVLEAEIELVDNEQNRVLAVFRSNSATGKYVVSLPAGHNYGIAVKAKGYLFHSENFIVSDTAGYDEVIKNIALKPVAVGNKIRLNNIFFEYEKADLSSTSIAELNRVLALMNEYPNLKIEVSGHTDNVGSRDYNLKLSTRRAQAVTDYLISKGIASGRIKSVGYGFDKPVATNTTEEGRKLNRRSEIKIIAT